MFWTKKWLLGLMGVMMSLGIMTATKCDTYAKESNYQIGGYIVVNTDTNLFAEKNANLGIVAEAPKGTLCTVVENDSIYTLVKSVETGAVGYLYQEFIGYDEAVVAAYQAELLAKSEEVRMLAALIQLEAGGEPIEGQIAVGCVVMNRVRSLGYPNTIADVIFAPGQFGPSRFIPEMMATDNIKPICREAAKFAFANGDLIGGATHFRRAGSKEGLVIGKHVFY